MRVFVTGASGYLGSALVKDFIHAGHEVTGLARSDGSARHVEGLGAAAIRGDLLRPGEWLDVAGRHDALVHAAMESGAERDEADRIAVGALLEAAHAAGKARAVLYTSVTFVLGSTGDTAVDETRLPEPPSAREAARVEREREVLDGATDRVATAVVRPGMIYGGRAGAVSDLFDSAEKTGAAVFVGDGRNRWPTIYRGDAAVLFRLVAERRGRGVFHAVDGSAHRVEDIARAASRAAGCDGRVRSWPLEDARRELGSFADALALDQVVEGVRARELGWGPQWPPFPEWASLVYEEWRAPAEAGMPGEV